MHQAVLLVLLTLAHQMLALVLVPQWEAALLEGLCEQTGSSGGALMPLLLVQHLLVMLTALLPTCHRCHF